MKNVLSLIFLALCLSGSMSLHASDTLTRAQIFNFSVGDTFDYKEHTVYSYATSSDIGDDIEFSRCVISNIQYSQNNDTLFITRQWVYPLPVHYDTLAIDSLNNVAVFVDSLLPPVDSNKFCQLNFSFDTTLQYGHTIVNSITIGCGVLSTWMYSEVYAPGLGNVSSIYENIAESSYATTDSINLIYYSNSNLHWGTPYYIANYSSLVHYIPIPEQDAIWIDDWGQLGAPEKVATGNRIALNGHVYVELLYSTRAHDKRLIIDSLIGYFRNDTLNRKAYLYTDINSAPFLTYDFSVPAEGNVTSLSQVSVGGQPRTYWNESCSGSIPQGYIEGVGGARGFGNIYSYTEMAAFEYWDVICGSLTCFSVNGYELYPDTSSVACSFPLSIDDFSYSPDIKVYPNPVNDHIQINYHDLVGGKKYVFRLINLLGEQVIQSDVEAANTSISCTNLTVGMYLWMVTDASDNKIAAGKLVKQ